MNFLKFLIRFRPARNIFSRYYQPVSASPIKLAGIEFSNCVGLAAGFDKNAAYLEELACMGFGSIEIGTVTPLPQQGNDKPRLLRLPLDSALINRMGFNNDGADQIVERLKEWRMRLSTNKHEYIPVIGGNIGKNKNTANDQAWRDYEISFSKLHSYVDYFVVNVSSPNTPGLRELQEKDALHSILTKLQVLNRELPGIPKPIFLKIAPDLTVGQVDDVIALSEEIALDGLVVANTTLDRNDLSSSSKEKAERFGSGGLSGKPLRNKSTMLVRYIHQKTDGRIPIIASGGIFTAEDAREKLVEGASLVQVWTGFIYEGPSIVKNICNNLYRDLTASK